MKKVAAIVMTAIIASSMFGCANRNVGYRNQGGMYRGTNQGTTQGTRTGYGTTNQGITQGTYRDGIYTGQGDRGSGGNGNQTATVTISGGRITNIILGTDTTANTGTTTGTTGTITGGAPGSTVGNTIGNMSGSQKGTPGYTTGDDSTQGIGANGGNAAGIMGGTSGGANTGYTTGGTGTTGITNYDTVRTQLANAMVTQQTSEVSLGVNDNSTTRNWKLAVRRALDNARSMGGTTR